MMEESESWLSPTRSLLITIFLSFLLLGAFYFSVSQGKYADDLDKQIVIDSTSVQLESASLEVINSAFTESEEQEVEKTRLEEILSNIAARDPKAVNPLLHEYFIKHLLFILSTTFDISSQIRGDTTVSSSRLDSKEDNMVLRAERLANGVSIAEVIQVILDVMEKPKVNLKAKWDNIWLDNFVRFFADSSKKAEILDQLKEQYDGEPPNDYIGQMNTWIGNTRTFLSLWKSFKSEFDRSDPTYDWVWTELKTAIRNVKINSTTYGNLRKRFDPNKVYGTFVKTALLQTGTIDIPTSIDPRAWLDFYLYGADVAEAIHKSLRTAYLQLSEKLAVDIAVPPGPQGDMATTGTTIGTILTVDSVSRILKDQAARSLFRQDIERSLATASSILNRHSQKKSEREDTKNGSFEFWGITAPIAWIMPFSGVLIFGFYFWFYLLFRKETDVDKYQDNSWFLTSRKRLFISASLGFAFLPLGIEILMLPGISGFLTSLSENGFDKDFTFSFKKLCPVTLTMPTWFSWPYVVISIISCAATVFTYCSFAKRRRDLGDR